MNAALLCAPPLGAPDSRRHGGCEVRRRCVASWHAAAEASRGPTRERDACFYKQVIATGFAGISKSGAYSIVEHLWVMTRHECRAPMRSAPGSAGFAPAWGMRSASALRCELACCG